MITVNTLGRFQVMTEHGVLNDENIRSAMLTKLLVYMIVFREQNLTIDKLTSALWQEEEVDNPAGALKNLMYRLRNLLKKNFGDKDYIITNRGAYCWNPDITIIVDVEEFEHMFEKAKEAGDDRAAAIYWYEKAIRLYQGEFMSQMSELHWVVTRSAYYHSMYISMITGLVELYLEEQMYEELEGVCSQALKYDDVNEEFHYYLIMARMKQNKLGLAIESYEKARKILNEQLGLRNPERLEEIYREILKLKKGKSAEVIEQVKADMTEENPQGAFFCGYPVFREIYRLEMRKKARFEEEKYILLLTVNIQNETREEVEVFRTKQFMAQLEKVLRVSLRLGDVVAKYSESQFVLLLSSCSYESGLLVANRILSRLYEANPQYSNIVIDVNMEEITAADDIVK